MVALASADLISVWQSVWTASPTEQAVALLTVTCPAESPGGIASLAVGDRDRRLIRLREELFGRQLALLVDCPDCHARVEIELTTSQITFDEAGRDDRPLSVCHDSCDIEFRLPTSIDLLAISRVAEVETRRKMLLRRCIESAKRDDQEIDFDSIPEPALTKVVDAMDVADPQANVEIPLRCIDCTHQWFALFDIATHLWSEVDAWVRRTLNEVHLLASAYGWSEAEILSLSADRRQLYVSMVRQ